MAIVNCCLRGNDCTWGKLNNQNAVVLQLLTDMAQESGFKLYSFTIELSFTEQHPAALSPQDNPANIALRILEPPSPKGLKGGETIHHLVTETSVQPEVSSGPTNLKAVQWKRRKERDIKASWYYRSHRLSDKHSSLTIAKWIWEANTDNPQIEDVCHLYAGLILQHPGQPFYVSCKIRGRLVRPLQAFLQWFKFGDDDAPIVTEILTHESDEDLQDLVRGLENRIVRLIRHSVASKLPPLLMLGK